MRRPISTIEAKRRELVALLERCGFEQPTVSTGHDLPDVYRLQEDTFLATVQYIPTRMTLLRTSMSALARALYEHETLQLALLFGAAIDTRQYAIAFGAAGPTPTAAGTADVTSIVAAATKQSATSARKLVITMKNITQATTAATKYLEEHPDLLMHYDETVGDAEWSTENGETNELTVYTHSSEHHFTGEYIVQLADDFSVMSVYTVKDECPTCINENLETLHDYEQSIRPPGI